MFSCLYDSEKNDLENISGKWRRCWQSYLYLSQTSEDVSELKEFADENFEFGNNGWKFSRLLENTAGKGEIARYEQFLLFPQCFQKTLTADT